MKTETDGFAQSGWGLLASASKARGLKTINFVRRPELVPELQAAGGDLVIVDQDGALDNIRATIGDVESKGGPGTCAFMPRNVPHAWKNCGSTPGRVLFLYTPAIAGRFVERTMEGPKSQEERDQQLKEYGWELLGPNPL